MMVNAVTRAADILRNIGEGKSRLTDISESLNLSKSTTHRLLKTLEKSGFVIQDPISRKYHLGYLILTLSSNPVIAHQDLILWSHKEMMRLRDISKETVALHIRIGTQRICLSEIPSNQKIRYTTGAGSVGPIYAGSAGKILLSMMDENESEKILGKTDLAPVGPRTITDRGRLLQDIRKIRKKGYATSSGETLEGAASISIPIRGYVCPAALSIFGPKYRLGPRITEFLKDMRKAERIISRLVGETLNAVQGSVAEKGPPRFPPVRRKN